MGRGIPYTRLAVSISVAVVVAVLLPGCTWEDPFPEYRGVNLLENRGIVAGSFADAYINDHSPSADYVNYDATLTAAEYGTTTGLPTGAETSIHRLELPNLLPDGDFETSAVAAVPDGWIAPATGSLNVIDGAGAISGRSAAFVINPGDPATFDLDAGMVDGFEDNAAYHLQLEFVRNAPDGEIVFDYGDGGTTSYLSLGGLSWKSAGRVDGLTPVEHLPTAGITNLDIDTHFASSNTMLNFLYAGAATVSDIQVSHGVLDNVRIGRLDIEPHVAVEVPLGSDDQLPLVAGVYTFSVYVKCELDSQVTPATPNRFRACQIVLGANDDFEVIKRTDGDWDSEEWTRISRTIVLEDKDLLNDPPLRLQMTVSDIQEPDVGSILIAEPHLELGVAE